MTLTLILVDPYIITEKKFENGSFESIKLGKSIERLNILFDDEIDKKAQDSFQKIQKDRNKIIHFYHGQFTRKHKSIVVTDQWVAWHYLHQILTNQWATIFKNYGKEIKLIHSKMRSHKAFLDERYRALKSKISADIKKGIQYINCDICQKKASKICEKTYYGSKYNCLVCEAEIDFIDLIEITINCPSCKKKYWVSHANSVPLLEYFLPYDESKKNKAQTIGVVKGFSSLSKGVGKCNCGKEIDTQTIIKECNKKFSKGSDELSCSYEDPPNAVYCCTCSYKKPSVFYIDDNWTCVICFDRRWDAMQCPHCEAFVSGDINKIEYFACVRCETQVRAQMKEELKMG